MVLYIFFIFLIKTVLYLFMEYSMMFQYMYMMYNEQIRVDGISITPDMYYLYWEHSKSSLLAILKYSINWGQS
jgi:hypothetical protein